MMMSSAVRNDRSLLRISALPAIRIVCSPVTLARLHDLPKGDAVAVARVAGIQAAKRTADWIPLAHPLPLDEIAVDLERHADHVLVKSRVVATARTGAEMEALVACSAAALALYDMVKAIDRSASVTDLRLDAKSGGASGDFARGGPGPR